MQNAGQSLTEFAVVLLCMGFLIGLMVLLLGRQLPEVKYVPLPTAIPTVTAPKK